eukprot:6853872-Alexandrium_andersonii.AAC.1
MDNPPGLPAPEAGSSRAPRTRGAPTPFVAPRACSSKRSTRPPSAWRSPRGSPAGTTRGRFGIDDPLTQRILPKRGR